MIKQSENSKNNLNYINNTNNKDVLGYLIATGGHYSVIKKCGNNWVLLDSLYDTPKIRNVDSLYDTPQIINVDYLKMKINTVINKNRPLVGVYLIKKITNSSKTDETSKSNANAIGKAKENILKEINESMKNNIKFGINYLTLEQLNELINEVKNIKTALNNNTKTKLILKKIIEIKKPNMIKYLIKDYKIESLKQILRKINNRSTNINSINFTKFINKINKPRNIGIPIGPGKKSAQQQKEEEEKAKKNLQNKRNNEEKRRTNDYLRIKKIQENALIAKKIKDLGNFGEFILILFLNLIILFKNEKNNINSTTRPKKQENKTDSAVLETNKKKIKLIFL